MRGLRLLGVGLAVLVTAMPARAPAAEPVSPPGVPGARHLALVDGAVFFDVGRTLHRVDEQGRAVALVEDAVPVGDAPVGTVVTTPRALVPADAGTLEDLYLLPAGGGAPVLLSDGLAESRFPRASLSSFTPDGRGIVFASQLGAAGGVGAQPCSTPTVSRTCDLFGWRDGVITPLDTGFEVPNWLAGEGYATDDFGRVLAAGVDGNPLALTYNDPIVAAFGTGAGSLTPFALRAVAADRSAAIVQAVFEDRRLYRWDGTRRELVGPDGGDILFGGASPDLSRVVYVLRERGGLAVRVDDTEVAAGDIELSPFLASDDAETVAFVQDGRLRVAGPDGLTWITRERPHRTALTGSTVALSTSERLSCADRDTTRDVYVVVDGRARLTTRTPDDVTEWILPAPDRVVYGDGDAYVADDVPGGLPFCVFRVLGRGAGRGLLAAAQ